MTNSEDSLPFADLDGYLEFLEQKSDRVYIFHDRHNISSILGNIPNSTRGNHLDKDLELRLWNFHPNQFRNSHKWFSKSELEYFSQRLQQSTSHAAKILYSQVLVNSEQKDHIQVRCYVDNLLRRIDDLTKKIYLLGNWKDAAELEYTFKELISISRQRNYKHEIAKRMVLEMLQQIHIQHPLALRITVHLGEFMVLKENRKIFHPEDVAFLPDILWNIIERYPSERKSSIFEQAYILGKKLNAKLIDADPKWDNALGEFYEEFLADSMNASPFLQSFYYKKALGAYKLAKKKKKITEIGRKLGEIKKKYDYLTIPIPEEGKKIQEEIIEAAHNCLNHDAPDIIRSLIAENGVVFPNEAALNFQVQNYTKNKLTSMIPIVHNDPKGNTDEEYKSEEEIARFNEGHVYSILLDLYLTPFVLNLFLISRSMKKFSGKEMVNFLEKTPFYGAILNNGQGKFRFIDYIASGLHEYFRVLYSEQDHNWILCIDSLVLKFEPIIRYLLHFLGGVTTKIVNKSGKQLEQEKDINDLFREEKILQKLSFEDHRFLKYLLIDKLGLNLRHRYAHGLVLPWEYTFENATLIVLGLLRLAKYDFSKQEQKENEDSDQ
jgi:hypothetical protein